MPDIAPDHSVVKSMPIISSRDRILLSAKRLFARNGYENTSTVAIAREAGTSESQLMKHFGSKQGLLVAIFDRGWNSIADRVQATQPAVAASDRLLGALQVMVDELDNDNELKDLVALESRRVRKDSRDILLSRGFERFAGTLDRLLAEMRDQGQLRPDVKLAAVRAALLGLTDGLLCEQVTAKRAGGRAEYGLDDIRKLLEALVPALAAEAVLPLRAVSQ